MYFYTCRDLDVLWNTTEGKQDDYVASLYGSKALLPTVVRSPIPYISDTVL